MFDYGQRSSFDNIPKWIEQVKLYRQNEDYQLLILGNKIDKDLKEVSSLDVLKY